MVCREDWNDAITSFPLIWAIGDLFAWRSLFIFQALENLATLDLSSNNFEFFPIEVTLLPNLVTLQFDQSNGRKIEELPEEIGNSTICHLHLDNNALTEIPGGLIQVRRDLK